MTGSGESGSGAAGGVSAERGGSEGVAVESSSRGISDGVAVESSSRGSSDGEAVSSSRVSSDGEAFGGIVIRSVTRSSESMSVLSRVGTDGRALADV